MELRVKEKSRCDTSCRI